MGTQEERLRIGELGRRVGLSEHVLRAWERRYGVLRPERSPGGFRLYTPADERRVRRMQDALTSGLSPAEAARTAIADVPDLTGADAEDLDSAVDRMSEALARFDSLAANAALDRMLAAHPAEIVLRDALLPYLRDLGDRWAARTADVTQEHFASNLIRARLGTLVHEGDSGGRLALLACAPGEHHDLPLLMLAVCLSRRGWRTLFLGADVPMPDLTRTAHEVQPDLVVVSASEPARLNGVTRPLRALAAATSVAVAGAGATGRSAAASDAQHIAEDPVSAAERLDALHSAGPCIALPKRSGTT